MNTRTAFNDFTELADRYVAVWNEPDAEALQFPERRQQIRDRPAPTIQPPDQHDVDLPPTSGSQQFLSRFPSGSVRSQ